MTGYHDFCYDLDFPEEDAQDFDDDEGILHKGEAPF